MNDHLGSGPNWELDTFGFYDKRFLRNIFSLEYSREQGLVQYTVVQIQIKLEKSILAKDIERGSDHKIEG